MDMDIETHRDILWVVLEGADIPGQAMNAVHACLALGRQETNRLEILDLDPTRLMKQGTTIFLRFSVYWCTVCNRIRFVFVATDQLLMQSFNKCQPELNQNKIK